MSGAESGNPRELLASEGRRQRDFKGTGTPAATTTDGDVVVMSAVQPCRDQWVATIGDCLAYAAASSTARLDRLGLLGFSLGGHLTLRAAKRQSANAVRAAVSWQLRICNILIIDDLPPRIR